MSDSLQTTYITIDPLTGAVSADFSGHIHVAGGVDTDADTVAPAAFDVWQFRWKRVSDGAMVAGLEALDTGAVDTFESRVAGAGGKLLVNTVSVSDVTNNQLTRLVVEQLASLVRRLRVSVPGVPDHILLDGSGFSDWLRSALLTAKGDLVTASGASTPIRLAIGATGALLAVSAGLPSWLAVGGSGTVLHGGASPTYSQIVDADVAATAAIARSKLAAGQGDLLASQIFSADVQALSGTHTEAAPIDVVSAGALTFDGATQVLIHFHATGADLTATVATELGLSLWDSTDQGRIARLKNPAAASMLEGGLEAFALYTPPSGSRTLKVRAWTIAAVGSPIVRAGAGGVATNRPGFIRVYRA